MNTEYAVCDSIVTFFKTLEVDRYCRHSWRKLCRGTKYLTVLTGSARHLYVVCIYGAICLHIFQKVAMDPAIFSPRSKILVLLYIVSKLMEKNSRFHGKIARYYIC